MKEGIVIGDSARINSCRVANPIGGDTKTISFDRGEVKIRIGNECGITNVTLFSYESIEIGERILIGGVKILILIFTG